MNLLNRVHTWLADNVKWIQYPNVTAMDSYTREASSAYRFKNKMTLGKRFDLTVFSLFLLVIGVIGTGVFLFILYLLIRALL